MRPATNTEEHIANRRIKDACTTPQTITQALNLTQCTLPDWTAGYHASGIDVNAYSVSDDVVSIAMGGEALGSSTSTSNSGSSGSKSGGGGGLSAGEGAGIAVGAILGALLVIGGLAFMVLRRRKARKGAGALPLTSEKPHLVRKSSQGSSDVESQN